MPDRRPGAGASSGCWPSTAASSSCPFDLMIGVNRRVYEHGVYQGQDLFDQRTSLIQYAELFNAFPDVHVLHLGADAAGRTRSWPATVGSSPMS